MPGRTVSAKNFCTTLEANADNEKLSDAQFRQFVRNSLPVVDYPVVPETTHDDSDGAAALVAEWAAGKRR